MNNIVKYIKNNHRELFDITYLASLLCALFSLIFSSFSSLVNWKDYNPTTFYWARTSDATQVGIYDAMKYKIVEYPSLWPALLNISGSLLVVFVAITIILLLFEKEYKFLSIFLFPVYIFKKNMERKIKLYKISIFFLIFFAICIACLYFLSVTSWVLR